MQEQVVSTESASDYVLRTSREYSIYVNEQRAIPRANDGLKDSQRKALWLMRNRSDKIKTISLAGHMIASGLYLHGDASAAEAVNMLAGPYVNNVPLLEGIGNFGKRPAPGEFAAPRYTYVKRNQTTNNLLYSDIDVVPLQENYDGSTQEPTYFLPLLPLLLLNGISGIAVGWKTTILPRSLPSLVKAVEDVIDGKTIKRIAPDYGYLDVDVKHLEGNSWEFTGKVEVVDTSTIRVKELPPDLSLEKFRERLDDYENEDKISSYEDNSTEKIDVLVKFKRGKIKGWTEEKIISFFKLRSRKTEAIVCIDWNGNAIKQYENEVEFIKDFVQWRFGYLVKRYEKFVEDDEYELKYWLSLKECFDHKLPGTLLSKKNKKEIVDEVLSVTSSIKPDEKQIDKIAGLPTYRWAQDYYQEVLDNIQSLKDRIKLHTSYLSNQSEIWKIYKNEVAELKKIKYSR